MKYTIAVLILIAAIAAASVTFEQQLERNAARSSAVTGDIVTRFADDAHHTHSYANAWLASTRNERDAIVYAELQAIYQTSDRGSTPEQCARSMGSNVNVEGIVGAIDTQARKAVRDADHGLDPFAVVAEIVGECVEQMDRLGNDDHGGGDSEDAAPTVRKL